MFEKNKKETPIKCNQIFWICTFLTVKKKTVTHYYVSMILLGGPTSLSM